MAPLNKKIIFSIHFQFCPFFLLVVMNYDSYCIQYGLVCTLCCKLGVLKVALTPPCLTASMLACSCIIIHRMNEYLSAFHYVYVLREAFFPINQSYLLRRYYVRNSARRHAERSPINKQLTDEDINIQQLDRLPYLTAAHLLFPAAPFHSIQFHFRLSQKTHNGDSISKFASQDIFSLISITHTHKKQGKKQSSIFHYKKRKYHLPNHTQHSIERFQHILGVQIGSSFDS